MPYQDLVLSPLHIDSCNFIHNHGFNYHLYADDKFRIFLFSPYFCWILGTCIETSCYMFTNISHVTSTAHLPTLQICPSSCTINFCESHHHTSSHPGSLYFSSSLLLPMSRFSNQAPDPINFYILCLSFSVPSHPTVTARLQSAFLPPASHYCPLPSAATASGLLGEEEGFPGCPHSPA